MNWYLKVVRDNYANFNGRARRMEYWMFTLFNTLIIFGLALIAGLFAGGFGSDGPPMIMFGLIGIYVLAVLIPGIAVAVRRLHDTGRSGWWYLISFVPYIGGIILFIFMVIEGNKGSNQYGPDPKGDLEEIDEIGKPVE